MLTRIPRLDIAEERRIQKNLESRDPKDVFLFKGNVISDPYKTECGRFSIINPRRYYGTAYIVWYLSVPEEFREEVSVPESAPSLQLMAN